MLEQVGGHRAVDELVLALHQAGYHHARTTVYNALDDLARAGLVRAAPVDAGALRYESAGPAHHHFVCRNCGMIINVPIAEDLASRTLPDVPGADVDELDVVYRGICEVCATSEEESSSRPPAAGEDERRDKSSNGHGERHEGGELIDLTTRD
jgi:Fe2+ or Zn2+ uptake regulation protein